MLDSRIAPEDVEMRIRNCIYLALYDRVFLHIHVIYDQDETSIAFLDEFLRKVDKRVIEHLAQERAAP
jgi:predicted SnoaL-like aldol condensation-catalyzing enzyme